MWCTLYLAVDGIAVHAKVLSSDQALLTDGAHEAVDVVDLLSRVHDELVS